MARTLGCNRPRCVTAALALSLLLIGPRCYAEPHATSARNPGDRSLNDIVSMGLFEGIPFTTNVNQLERVIWRAHAAGQEIDLLYDAGVGSNGDSL